MKRSLAIALVLSLVAAGAALAQPYTLMAPTVGVRGGIDIASERLSPLSNGVSKKTQTGGAAAINYEMNLWQPPANPDMGLSLRTDLMYVRNGGKFVSGGITEKDNVDQLRLAPFLVYRFMSRSFVPLVEAGPYGGVDLSHKYTTSGMDANGNPVSQSGTIPNWQTGDFGLNAGLGFKVPTAMGAISVDGRYSWGLVNRFKSGGGNNVLGQGSGIKRHTDGLLIMAGYDFNLSRMGRGY